MVGNASATTEPIIAAVDAREESRDAIQLAAELALGTGAAVEAAAVLDYGPLEIDLARHEELLAGHYRRIFEQTRAQQRALHYTEHRLTGPSPPRAISELAERLSAGLVVLGSTHRGRIGRVLPGSVGDRLLSGGSSPVAIAPRGYAGAGHRIERIGVGLDGREESLNALAFAADLADALEASIALVAVVPPPPVWSSETIIGPVGFQEAVREDLERALEEGSRQVDGVTETALLEGDPASTLAERSEQLDLIVVGSRGYGPVGRALMGDVASRLARSAACPVVLIPRGWHDRESEASG